MSHYWIKLMTLFGQGINDGFPLEKWVDRSVCGFVYIWMSCMNFEIMLRSLIEYGKCIRNVELSWIIIFPSISVIGGQIFGNDIRQFCKNVNPQSSIRTSCSLNQMQQPGPCYTLILPRRMIQPSGISEGGSCYICSAAVNCGLEKCISLGALNALVMS